MSEEFFRHSFVRYARPIDVDGDVVNGSAFELKVKDEGMLSVNWRGFYDPTNTEMDISCIRKVVGSRLILKKSGRFAELSISTVSEVAEIVNLALSVEPDPLHDGTAFDPAASNDDDPDDHYQNLGHAIMAGLPPPDAQPSDLQSELVQDLLAQRVEETFKAVSG